MEEPDPFRRLDVEGLIGVGLQDSGGESGVDAGTEPGLVITRVEQDNAVISEGLREDARTGISGPCIDTDDGVRVASLPAEDREDRGKPDRAIRCDDDRRDAVASGQTACFLSRRR